MSVTIGRAVIGCGPSVVQHDGNRVQLAFTVTDLVSVDAAGVLRQQLLGLTEPGQSDIPVRATDDEFLNGIYRVESVNVAPLPLFYTTGVFQFTISMMWLGEAPPVEVRTRYGLRENSHGILAAAVTPVITIPNVEWWGTDSTAFTSSVATVAGSEQVINIVDNTGAGTVNVAFIVDSVEFYRGAARVEYTLDTGVSWHVAVGQHLPTLDFPASGRVRITNGIVRLTIGGYGLEVERWSSATGTWLGATYEFRAPPFTVNRDFAGKAQPTIIRNDPAGVTVRWFVDGGGVADITLLRGWSHVEGRSTTAMAVVNNPSILIKMAEVSLGLGALITGGMQRSSVDADGSRWVLMSPDISASNTGLEASITNVTEDWAFGLVASAAVPNLVALYYAGVSQTQRVVL